MRAPQRKNNSGLVILAWGLNIAGLLALSIVFAFYLARQPAEAASNPTQEIFAPRPTYTAAPTIYYLPTVTPNPYATEIEDFNTPTPFAFSVEPSDVIGYSVEGRPIDVYSFGQGESKYLIVAGIHGGYEGNTIALANQLMLYITEHPEVVPSGDTLYVIPDMNPDAAARGRNADARVNANGVDLNRNFPTQNWMPNWDHTHCWNDRPTTGGAYGGSEPETQAVMNFILHHRIRAMISYHSAALGVFPGGDPWQEASQELASQLAKTTNYPYPPIDIGCVYTGTLADWAVQNNVSAAVDMELSTHQSTDFNLNLQALKVLLGF